MLKKFCMGLGIFIITVYVLFLAAPLFLSGIANSYGEEISKLIEDACGFKVKLENIRVLTTPKLTIGAGVGHVDVALPTGETFLTADNVEGKLSLLPVLLKDIELDKISADNINLNLKVKKGGKFLIEDYITQNNADDKNTAGKNALRENDAEKNNASSDTQTAQLPLGLKLSNRMPDIYVNNYNVSFIDMPTDKAYSIYGNNISVTDFILNKKVKINADGKFQLHDRVQFGYDIKILNKIMPDIDLNELVFSTKETEQPAASQTTDIIKIFEAIYKNQFTADVKADINTSGTLDDMYLGGTLNVSNISIDVNNKKLPAGSADITLKNDKINIYAKLFTGESELTELVADIKSGKHPKINLNCKSNARLKSIVNLANSVAKTFGVNELETLAASGGIDADFTLETDFKNTKSSGYLKIPSASVAYKLYNFAIGKITANVDFSNNLPDVKADLSGINYKDIPSNTALNIQSVNIVKNVINVSNILVNNPAAKITFPSAKISVTEKEININSANLVYDVLKFNISGLISDYLTQNIKLDMTAKSDGEARIKGSVKNLQDLDLSITTPKTLSIEIPGFKKSNLKIDTNLNISGNMSNPILKGTLSVPSVTIPDMNASITDLDITLNGVLHGNAVLKKVLFGGISAENLSSDFDLKNDVFYLKNIKGNAFDGQINGDVSYGISNGHIGVKFKGTDLDAEKAIAGAAGIKNALSGKLGFNADVTLHGATDVEMMKNLKGKVSFEILDGSFGNIGRFENFLSAGNITSNSVLKAAVNSISALPEVKNTAQFKSVSGDLTFNNGWANLNPVKTSGPSMAYYITGKYNLLNGTANITVLGRLSAEVVKLLGVLGDLSVDKLTSFIPKFGSTTAAIINALTSDPKNENVSAIPALSSGNENYKDFKVLFNGGVESKSAVKSFKWLSKCDTSAIESMSVKEQVQTTKEAVKEAYQAKTQAIEEKLQQQKEEAQAAKQQMQNAKEGLKNLKNILK